MTSWKTTLCGVLVILGGILGHFTEYPLVVKIGLELVTFANGLGLLFARDNRVTSEQALGLSRNGAPPRAYVGLLLIGALCVGLTFGGVACKNTSPQTVSYRATGATVVTVETLMSGWNAYVGAKHPGTNAELRVKAAYEKYQAAAVVVCDAGAAYSATGGTNGTAQAALNVAIANAGQTLTDLQTLVASFK